MIPKIIHFCWMSDDAYPEKIQKCIDSWKRILPDYQIVRWSYANFPKGQSKWVDQAFDTKKYAFCADYLRCYAVYNYGGIYLDSDVEVIKSFDDLLNREYFIGQEASDAGIEAAVFGAEKGNELLKSMLDYYDEREFVKPDGTLDKTPMPIIFRRIIDSEYPETEIFPVDYFSPKDFMTEEILATQNTYSIHHFAGTWMTSADIYTPPAITLRKRMRRVFKRLLPFYRKINLLSQSDMDSRIASIMRLKTILPLQDAIISDEDMCMLCDGLRSNKQLHPVFIKRSGAKKKAEGYYPILSFEEIPDVEIHYPAQYMNSAIKEMWELYFSERRHNTTIFLNHSYVCKGGGVFATLMKINLLWFKKKEKFVEI